MKLTLCYKAAIGRAKTSVAIVAATLIAVAGGVWAGTVLPLSPREAAASAGVAAPARYMGITDIHEKMRVSVPVEWSDTDTGNWRYRGERVGVFLAASTNLSQFYDKRPAPGVFIGVSRVLAQRMSDQALLALEQSEFGRTCQHLGRFDYRDKFYVGSFDRFSGCNRGNHQAIVLTTATADRSRLILLRITAVAETDQAAVARILETFQVLGDPEADDHGD